MVHWVDRLFEFLFKYRPAEFANARFAFGAPFSVIVLLLAAAAIGVPAVLSYASVRGRSSRRDRWVLGALRVAALAVLMVCLFRPMLLLSAAVPQRNYVGVLVDDSRSMRIADRDGKARSDWVEHAFGGPDSSLLKALRERFIVRLFRFSSSAQRIDSVADVTFTAGATHVGTARGAGAPGARRRAPLRPRAADGRRGQLARADLGRALVAARAFGADLRRGAGRRALRPRHRDQAGRGVALGAQGRLARRGPGNPTARLRRTSRAARRRGRRADRVARLNHVATGRRRSAGARHGDGERSGAAILLIPDSSTARRASRREQRAAGARRRARRPGEDSLRRGRAAVRDAVHSRGGRGGLEPPARRAAAHGGQQVLATERRQRERPCGRIPEEPRGAVPLSRGDHRQRRGELLHARPAGDARRFRQRTRRRPAAARRTAKLRRGRLRRNAARRRDAGGDQRQCGRGLDDVLRAT